MSVALNSNGSTLNKGHLSESKLSLNSLSSYPSRLDMISNEIYLSTVSSLNNVLSSVEKMIETSGTTSPILNLYEIDKMVNALDVRHANQKNVNFHESSADPDQAPESIQGNNNMVAKSHCKNKMIRSFLRLLKPSISKNRNKDKSKKGSIGRAKFRSGRTIGVLNSSDEFRVRKKESFRHSGTKSNDASDNKKINKSPFLSSHSMANKQRLKSTRRALSLLTRSAKFSTSASDSSVCCSSPTNFNSSSILSANEYSSMSKELNWYRLEELDHYYKILGNE
jgi:hypothetical protein